MAKVATRSGTNTLRAGVGVDETTHRLHHRERRSTNLQIPQGIQDLDLARMLAGRFQRNGSNKAMLIAEVHQRGPPVPVLHGGIQKRSCPPTHSWPNAGALASRTAREGLPQLVPHSDPVQGPLKASTACNRSSVRYGNRQCWAFTRPAESPPGKRCTSSALPG